MVLRRGGRCIVLFIVLAVAAVFTVGMAFASDEAKGHRAPGQFDLEQARAERQMLHDRLSREMPVGTSEQRVRVVVSDEERAQIADSDEWRLRVGIVKTLGVPPIIFDASPAGIHGSHGSRTVGVTDGSVWAVTLESPGATAVRLHFTDFDLAPGAKLYLHTERGEAFGPYTNRGPLGTGEFWSHTIAGDTVTVQTSNSGRGRSWFTIPDIGYMDLTKVHGNPTPDPQTGEQLCSFNANCVENANCNSIPPAIQSARDAMAHMEFVSGAFLYYCSGGLLADTDSSSQIPYFLTANHCLSSNKVASSLQAFFQYEVACNGTCPTLYFYNQEPPPYPRTLGATVKSSNSGGDYTLLQLSEAAPSGSFFLGWTSTPVANSNGTALYRISHPGGAPQAYSTHSVDTSAPTCSSWPRGERIYSRDTLGATEGGSSGSPVLNSSGQAVGQLSGACGFNVNDVCDSTANATVDGALAYYWSSVAPFLDPAGGCTVTENPEVSCSDGVDNDCDGATDSNDSDCFGGSCTPAGQLCTANSECCSNSCKGKPGAKKCK
ncbi:MAG: trypsin-like peptidase domain-containing protein [Candidatus Komeilibacteria bacterium]|nr:trypsin-like peptidase domain-containing protein [Candidatus Komeilibacteria bacterium]